MGAVGFSVNKRCGIVCEMSGLNAGLHQGRVFFHSTLVARNQKSKVWDVLASEFKAARPGTWGHSQCKEGQCN